MNNYNKILGTYTIRQVLWYTMQSKFSNRAKNLGRDVLKTIQILQIKRLYADRPLQPQYLFKIRSFSYPQYVPYVAFKIKSKYKKQRSIKHNYDIVLELDTLSVNTKSWKMRVGSEKLLPKHVPKDKLQAIPIEIKKRIRQKIEKKYKRWKKGKAFIEQKYKEELQQKQRSSRYKYVSKGDYIARGYGIMLDWFYRCQWVWRRYGHLYGRMTCLDRAPNKTNPKKVMFFDKHSLGFILFLVNKGILKNI